MENTSMNHSKSHPPCLPRDIYSLDLDRSSVNSNDFIMTFIIINAMLAFISSCNNFVIIYTIARTASIQVPSNILVLGLAISDFGVGILAQPAYSIFKFFEMKRSVSLYCTFGLVYSYSYWTLATVSFFTLTAITVDRFLAVHIHLRYQELVTVRRYGILLGCIWVISSVTCVCRMQLSHMLFIRVVGVLSLVFLITLNLYFLIKIFQVICRHSIQIQAQQQSVQQSIDMPRYKKSVNTMYYVIGAFLVCYVPYVGTMIVYIDASKKITQHKLMLLVVTQTLVMLNGMLNPIIYFWRIQEIRHSAFQLFRKSFGNFQS
ncbi:G-protein coupled receptor 3-like [Actinia tenebrosa]|uniref:G-protein coupled receptor 3-like n=1 Tax=Actinia tenebrosa TaxID=6105 RepID=A0A6P8J3L7_ACTTE|nr:G-protein coupled receptor 3-like [Actinia tenebrosa]